MYKIIKKKQLTSQNFGAELNLSINQTQEVLDLEKITATLLGFGWGFSNSSLTCFKEDTVFELSEVRDLFISEQYIGYLADDNKILNHDLSQNTQATTYYIAQKALADRREFINEGADIAVSYLDLFATTRDFKNYEDSIKYRDCAIAQYSKEAQYLKETFDRIQTDIRTKVSDLIQNPNQTANINAFLSQYNLAWPT